MSRRTIVIGDIHGCFDELRDLLDRAAFGSEDRVVAAGDLIVKGEQNREVLDLFSTDERFRAVLGNHDLALLRYWKKEKSSLKPKQKSTLAELEPQRARYYAYLNSLPLMIDLGSHVVVHAGVRPGIALEEQSAADLTELRTLGSNRKSRVGTPWYEVYDGEQTVLFGHWPAPQPRRGPRAIGLDTGCVYGYQLTAYILETGEFVSVRAHRAYDRPKPKIVRFISRLFGPP
ncbi:MAG: metallophosphoesterase [Acidobacteria bacterium]|nr:metallophosphoesterase [Acidobacteriota bacterium]